MSHAVHLCSTRKKCKSYLICSHSVPHKHIPYCDGYLFECGKCNIHYTNEEIISHRNICDRCNQPIASSSVAEFHVRRCGCGLKYSNWNEVV